MDFDLASRAILHRQNECTTDPLKWAGLVISILCMNVFWWALDIPLIFRHGFKVYISSVSWQCLRLYMPSLVGIMAVGAAPSPQDIARIYYSGPFYHSNNDADRASSSRAMSNFQIAKCLLTDIGTIVATGINVYNAIKSTSADQSGANFTLWVYPSLPVAVIGLWLLACSGFKVKNRLLILLGGILALAAAGAAFGAPLAHLSSAKVKQDQTWVMAVIFYAYMSFPLALFNNLWLHLIGIAIGLLGRILGIGLGAISDSAYFPYCPLRNKAFGVTYITVGSIGAALALGGLFRFWHGYGGPIKPPPAPATRNPPAPSAYEPYGGTRTTQLTQVPKAWDPQPQQDLSSAESGLSWRPEPGTTSHNQSGGLGGYNAIPQSQQQDSPMPSYYYYQPQLTVQPQKPY